MCFFKDFILNFRHVLLEIASTFYGTWLIPFRSVIRPRKRTESSNSLGKGMTSGSSVFKPTWSMWTCDMPSHKTLLSRLPQPSNSKKWIERLKRYWGVSCLMSILDVSGIRPLKKQCWRISKIRLQKNQLEGRPWSGSKLQVCLFVCYSKFLRLHSKYSPSRELQLQSTRWLPSTRTVSKGPGNDAPCMSTNFFTIPSILVLLTSGTCT